MLWEVVGADDPDPRALLAAAHAAQAAPRGGAAADTLTTGEILQQRGWSHTYAAIGSSLPEHYYISPDHRLQACYLPPSRFGSGEWTITTPDADEITAYGPTPATVVNALLLTPAHTAPDTDTTTGI